MLQSKGVIKSSPIVAKTNKKGYGQEIENFANTKTDSLNNLLMQEQTARIEAYKQLDSIKKIQFVSDILQPKEFFHTLEDSIVKIDFKARGFGELKNIELSYTRKTINTPVKQYAIFLGVNTVSNPSFSNMAILPTISYNSPNGMLYSFGKDLMCDGCYMVGLSKSVWIKNRVK